MPSKKRKYEARFPPARIKKIMQTDEEIGKVAAAVPVIISRSLEIFLQSLVERTAKVINERKAKTMTPSHLKCCIESEKQFDFLTDLVANISHVANVEDEDNDGESKPKKVKKPRAPTGERRPRGRPKKQTSSGDDESDEEDAASDQEEKAPIHPRTNSKAASQANSSTNAHSNAASHCLSKPPPLISDHNNHTPPPSLNHTAVASNPPTTLEESQSNGNGIGAPPVMMNFPMSMPSVANDDEDDDYDT